MFLFIPQTESAAGNMLVSWMYSLPSDCIVWLQKRVFSFCWSGIQHWYPLYEATAVWSDLNSSQVTGYSHYEATAVIKAVQMMHMGVQCIDKSCISFLYDHCFDIGSNRIDVYTIVTLCDNVQICALFTHVGPVAFPVMPVSNNSFRYCSQVEY